MTEVRPGGGGFRAFFDGMAKLLSGRPRLIALISLFAAHARDVELRPPVALAARVVAALGRSRAR